MEILTETFFHDYTLSFFRWSNLSSSVAKNLNTFHLMPI